MTILFARVHDELLRWVYALSLDRWPMLAVDLALLVLAGTFAFTAWRLVSAAGLHGPRAATPRRESA